MLIKEDRVGKLLSTKKMTDYIIKKFVLEKAQKNNTEVRRRLGMLSGYAGIICNILLSAGKFFAGIITSSIAISADAFNNLSDAISSIVTLICFKASGNPADKEHPFGYGRIEYVSGLIVSIAIIFMGLEFIKTSVEKIFNPEPTTIALIPTLILIGSLVVKLWLCMFNRKIGKILDSTAIKATAFDSFGDVIATLAILSGMAVTYFTGISVDAYSGIVVAIFIICTGVGMIKETLNPLLGASPDPNLVKRIHEVVLSSSNVLGIHDLIVHNYGPNTSVISFHAEMPADKNIMELHESIDKIEKKLKETFNCKAIIHIDPIVTDDEQVNSVREKISHLVKLLHRNAKVYDLRIIPGKKPTLIFHLSVPYDIEPSDNEIEESVSDSIRAIYDNYKCIIDVDRNYFESKSDIKKDNKI